MADNQTDKGNSAPTAPLFITQEQFETVTKKLIESHTSAYQAALDKLTEQLKVIIPAKAPEPSAPVAPSTPTAPTREQEFNDNMKKVAEWFGKIRKSPFGETGSIFWSIPQDVMLKRMGYNYDSDFDNGKKATEDITFQSGTKMTKYVKKFIFLKGGRFITPIRQYCDFQPLEDGQTAQWYTFDGGYDFGAVSTGSAPTAVTSTIDKVTAQPSVRGGFQKVGYDDIEMSPAPLVDAVNTMATVAALADESKDLLTTVCDAASPATNHWVQGDTGAVITADTTFASSKTLKVAGVLAAKKQIIKSLGDPAIGNLVLFCGTQAYNDLLLNAVTYTQYTRASEIDNGTLETILGVEVVPTDNISRDPTTNTRERNILAVKGVAFGLTSGRDLSMEASRRNELQQVFLTANQRVKSAVLNSEAWVRISSYVNN